MTCFTTNSKISTQLGFRAAPCLGKCYKAFFFGHYINFIPWHKSHFNVTDVLVLSVTYVFVSYPPYLCFKILTGPNRPDTGSPR